MKKLSIIFMLMSMTFTVFGQKATKGAIIQAGTYTLTNKNSNLCLAVRGATKNVGEEATQWTCDGNADKNWTIIDAGGGYYKIQSANSKLFLAVGGGSKDYGGRVIQWNDEGQEDVKWRFLAVNDGSYKIQNKNSGLVLAVGAGSKDGGANLVQWGDEGQDDVKWWLTLLPSIKVPIDIAYKSCIVVYEQPNFQGRSQMYCDAGNFNLPFVVRSIRVPTGFVIRGWEGEFEQDYTANNSSFILGSYNTAITVGKTATIPVATWQGALNGVFGASCVRLNNFTPNQNQYNRNEREFFRPNDSYIKLNLNGNWLNYPIPIDVIQTGPNIMYKMYINDWNTNRIVAAPENGRIKITLYFEDDGIEIVGKCYNNGLCAFSPAPNFNYSNSRIDIYLDLIASGGQLSYNASNIFTSNVVESGPCVNNLFAMFCPSDRAGLIKGTVESTINQHLNSSVIKPLLSSMLTRLAPNASSVNRVSVNARGDISIW